MSKETVQGHGTSQLQFSKYVPSSFHAISASSVAVTRFSPPRERAVKSDRLRRVAEALIQDERLEWIVRGLDSTGWAAEVCDADWKLIWVSPQTCELIGEKD